MDGKKPVVSDRKLVRVTGYDPETIKRHHAKGTITPVEIVTSADGREWRFWDPDQVKAAIENDPGYKAWKMQRQASERYAARVRQNF